MQDTERLTGLAKLSNAHAATGYGYHCPEPGCGHWASLGGNAVYHAERTGHGVPELRQIPDDIETISRPARPSPRSPIDIDARMEWDLPPVAGAIETSHAMTVEERHAFESAPLATAEAHVARVNAAADEVTRAASAWVLADRLADARADELDEAVTLLGRASADARADLQALWGGVDKPDDGTPRPANAALLVAIEHKAQVEHGYQSACELEQDRDDRLRAAARALVKALESGS